MYYPVQIPRLSMDLVKRLYPLCQRLQIPMDQFVREAIAQAVARKEEKPGPAHLRGLAPSGPQLAVATAAETGGRWGPRWLATED